MGARRRPAAQISIGWGGSPSRAVDGKTNGHYGHGSCTHTQRQPNPWWRVTLKAQAVIRQVKIWNRTDCCGSRLGRLQVFVGDKPYWNGNKPCSSKLIKIGKSRLLNCPKLPGKFVFVVLRQNQYLTLCEVKVYGTAMEGKKKIGPKSKTRTETKKAKKRAPKPKPNLNSLNLNKKQGWKYLGGAPYVTVSKNLCLVTGQVTQQKRFRAGTETLIGRVPPVCIPQHKQTFHLANGPAASAQVTVDGKGRIMAYKMGKTMSRLSLNGIYYLKSGANSAKAKQSPTYKIVKGYAGFSAARVGPYCIVSGFVTGKGKKLGTLPKKCWPKQKLIFDVASNVPGALVKINVAGVVEVDLSGHVKGQKARKLRLKKAEARMASNERTAKAAAKKKGKKKGKKVGKKTASAKKKKKKSTAKKTTKKKKSTAKTKTKKKKKKSTARSSEETALLQLDTSADIESEKKKTPAKLAKQKKTQGKAVSGVSISLAGIVFSVHDQHFFKGFTHEGQG